MFNLLLPPKNLGEKIREIILFLTTCELVPRGHKPLFVPFFHELFSKWQKETKLEKENSSSPILYDVILRNYFTDFL